jgi:hypothetical protein
MMIRRLTMAAAATGLTLGLAACGSDSGSGSGGGDAAVSWMEKVCASVEGEVAVLSQSPDVDTTDPKTAKENMLTYLMNFSIALDRMVSGIKEAGAPPVADSTKVVDAVTTALGGAKKGVDDTKTALEKTTINTPEELQAALTKVGEDMSKLSQLDDPTKDFKANEELNNAFDKAPTCKRLGGSVSTPTS